MNFRSGIGENLLERVEEEARRLGLPLATLELLGQDGKVARDFVRAARRGDARIYVDRLDLDALERVLSARELDITGPAPVGMFRGQ